MWSRSILCRIEGAYRSAASARNLTASARQLGASSNSRQASAFSIVDERLPQQRLDREQLLSAQALDLLDDVLPVHLVINSFTAGETVQQFAWRSDHSRMSS
jgi:hypothetical protein